MPKRLLHDGARLDRRSALLAFAIVAMAGVHALVAALMPLSEDEAYYRLWGLAPALSYLDHPPMVGWMIAAGRKSKISQITFSTAAGSTVEVSNRSTINETGCALPIA